MKKIVFGIFAHPDDEAFGPSGALLLEAKVGNDIHLITLTAGEAGMNPDNVPNLAETRLTEWKASGDIIGAKSMQYLGYHDGQLSNRDMVEIGSKLVDYIRSIIKDEPADTVVELMSMDLNGVTGHIDHIVAGRAACYAFYTLKSTDPRLTRIRLSCIPDSEVSTMNTEWLFMEAGRTAEEIGEVVDARAHKEELGQIVHAHHSQRHDGENYLQRTGDKLGLNYFIVKT